MLITVTQWPAESGKLLTAISLSISSRRPSRALTSAMCACSILDLLDSSLTFPGDLSLSSSTSATYSSRVEDTAVMTADTFHGFVEV